MSLILPENYDPHMTVRETQEAIKYIRDTFQREFGKEMNLERISAPLFVEKSSGLNDNLNGVERPVQFDVAGIPGETVEVVHSLAKWKRMALKKYDFEPGEGLYTNMNAIRRDEELDNLHSCYVDQWDWEKVIENLREIMDTLKETDSSGYKVLSQDKKNTCPFKYDYIHEILPKDIFFVTTRELEEMFPDNTPKEREYYIAQAKGAVCIMQIGDKLECGEPHDGRAPDYDDWALNADIVVYYPVLDIALELSSMGIRVDEVSLKEQLDKAGCPERAELPFQKAILEKKLPYTMGGGIGQSRICMFFLRKAHIGEVQCSLWPEEMEAKLKEAGIQLL